MFSKRGSSDRAALRRSSLQSIQNERSKFAPNGLIDTRPNRHMCGWPNSQTFGRLCRSNKLLSNCCRIAPRFRAQINWIAVDKSYLALPITIETVRPANPELATWIVSDLSLDLHTHLREFETGDCSAASSCHFHSACPDAILRA